MTARRDPPAGRTAGRAAPGGGTPRRRTSLRHGVVLAGLVVAIAALLGRLAFVQVLDGTAYASYATSEVDQSVVLPAARGAIYDRTGDLLAVSVARYDVIADDFLIPKPRPVAAELAPLLGMSTAALDRKLSLQSGYVVLAREVSDHAESAIAGLNLEGITFQNDTLREYPGGEVFQPLLGGVNAAGQGDAALEYAFDGMLGGRAGHEVVAEAPGGLQLPLGATDVVPPKEGTSLVLTLDLPLQVEVTKDLTAEMRTTHAHSGIAVVENVHTGGILAMVDLVTGPKGTIVPAEQNLAATSIYQPGSVMKLATIGYALQDRIISPSTTFTVPYSIKVGGYTFEDADGHPTEVLPVSQILAQSSNVGTIEISKLLGMERLYNALKTLGFGSSTGLNWPAESSGIIGEPAQWYGSAAASVPIGTGVAVTPLQVLDAYNAVANGGVLISPRIVQATVVNGHETQEPLAAGRRVFQPSTVAQLVPMLEGVTTDETGTALLANVPGYKVAGKTGTAQVPDQNGLGYVAGDWNATFVGFAPANAPELSGIVVLNHPTPIYGGTVAAPVFAQVMKYALSHFDIAPPKTVTASR